MGTFTGLGLLMTALLGPESVQRFATHWTVNLALGLLFIVMAVNLFGGFEIILPGWMIEKVQGGTTRAGLIGPLFMGLAFTVTSFTCTFAFVGGLLAWAAASGNYLYPVLGMLTFSAAFASPFFLLALFPQYLAKMPKSGGWLVNVKAFLGFVELMAALKFLSNVDLFFNAGVLTRDVYLALWFGIAAVAGFFMLGLLKLPHDAGVGIGPIRRGIGVVTLAFAVWLLTGINGAALGWAVAFLPPPEYGRKHVEELAWTEDYDAALAQARAENKLLFLDFTGYQCSNCRLMEQDVFPRPEVRSELEKMVRVRLYTDANDERSRRYAKMQVERYSQTTLPLYVVITPDEETVAVSPYNANVTAFASFLKGAGAQADRLAKRD
jgi:thiol:disulfide interchange protein DsbD